VSGSVRRYNDEVVRQLLTFRFAQNRMNVGVYGITDAGKSYFMAAFCKEACRKNYRCKYVDYCDLLDELLVLSRYENLDKYRKKLKYYSRIQILFLDDFAISRYSEEGIKILYHLIKTRTDLGTSTMFTCQYAPSEWGKQLSDEEGCYGKLDGIRRRLTTGYTVHIEKL
jgi:DNA replication protein DnaC